MSTKPEFDAAHMFARIAHDLAAQTDLPSTSQRVVELAQDVTGCDSTAMWSLTDPDHVKLHAATDPALAEQFGETITKVHEGMAWECLRSHTTVLCRDIRVDHRWPSYRESVLSSPEPFLSAVGYSLDIEGRSLGALILASRQADYFSADLIDVGAIFAEHAAICIEAATAEQKAENLQLALGSNRRIGMAIGILMGAYVCTEEHAFDLLRAASQRQHHKLRDVAEEVILTGTLPELPVRKLA
jgi:GAF domain-containing protein